MTYKEVAERAKKAGSRRSISPEFVKWGKPGQVLVGIFRGRHMVESRQTEGRYFQYLWDTDEGPVKCHMGSNFDAEQGSLLKEGCLYDIEYQGKEDIGSGRSVNRFQTYLIADSDTALVESETGE